MPGLLHDGFSITGISPLYDLGDVNLDGLNDIWTYCHPWLICYLGGEDLDSLVNARVDTRGIGTMVVARGYPGTGAVLLGDIDGSGVPTIGINYDQYPHRAPPFPGGIMFVKPSDKVQRTLQPHRFRRVMPHLEGESCGTTTAVVTPNASPATDDGFDLRLIPNPTRSELEICWPQTVQSDSVEIRLTSTAGVEMVHQRLERSGRCTHLRLERLPTGAYLVTVIDALGRHSRMLIVD
jgi:hypothetical protein